MRNEWIFGCLLFVACDVDSEPTAVSKASLTQAISFVQVNSASPQATQSTAGVRFGSKQGAGDLNVIVVSWNDNVSHVLSVADTAGNTYRLAPKTSAQSANGQASIAIYYASNTIAASANLVTATFNQAVPYPEIVAAEYAGCDTIAPFDVGSAATGTSATTQSGTLNTSGSSELLVAGNYVLHTTTGPGPNFTQRLITYDQDILEDGTSSSPGPYSASATLTQSGWWLMAAAAFRPPQLDAGTVPPEASIDAAPDAMETSAETGSDAHASDSGDADATDSSSGDSGSYGSSDAMDATADVMVSDSGGKTDAPRDGATDASGGDSGTSPLTYSFPLKLAPGARYPVDQNGTPFLLKGDCGWGVITTLDISDSATYFSNRLAKGFNTIWIGLIDNIYAANTSTGADANGNLPFLKALDGTAYTNATTQNPDFSTPNEAYFVHVDQVLNLAASDGLLVLLSPAWVGYGGGGPGTEGYYTAMTQMSAATLQGYGQFLGKRYGSLKNIVWHHGGDWNPPNKTVVENIVTGLKEYDTSHLNSVDTLDGTSPMDYWASEPWLDLDNVYTDILVNSSAPRVYAKSFTEYQLTNWKPFFLKEGAFEGEHDSAPSFIRQQAYEGLLSGGFGQSYGNNPVWLFASGWQSALNSRGALDMQQFNTLFTNRHWEKLVPDITNLFVINGGSYSGAQHFAAARATDGSWGVVYVPTGNANALTIDLSGFSGPVSFSWIDPTSGSVRAVAGSPFANNGTTSTAPPGANAQGDNDWVLLIGP
jgi:hypothetical protein